MPLKRFRQQSCDTRWFGVQGVWKMPTGLANASEDVSEAAVREVLEVRRCVVRELSKGSAGMCSPDSEST